MRNGFGTGVCPVRFSERSLRCSPEEIAYVTRSTIDIVNRSLSWAREKLHAPTFAAASPRRCVRPSPCSEWARLDVLPWSNAECPSESIRQMTLIDVTDGDSRHGNGHATIEELAGPS